MKALGGLSVSNSGIFVFDKMYFTHCPLPSTLGDNFHKHIVCRKHHKYVTYGCTGDSPSSYISVSPNLCGKDK